MICSTDDAAKALRKALKEELGYNARQVSVRKHLYSMGSSLYVTIRARGVDKAKVTEIANRAQIIRYCEVTQEILSGSNRFVNVDFDRKLVDEASLKVAGEVDEACKMAQERPGYTFEAFGWNIWWCDVNREFVLYQDEKDMNTDKSHRAHNQSSCVRIIAEHLIQQG